MLTTEFIEQFNKQVSQLESVSDQMAEIGFFATATMFRNTARTMAAELKSKRSQMGQDNTPTPPTNPKLRSI